MDKFVRVIQSRANSQSGASIETSQAVVTKIYSDEVGNVVSADVSIDGQAARLKGVQNSSGLKLFNGAKVTVNYRKGSRNAPQITGSAGATSGSSAISGSADSAVAGAAASSAAATASLSGIPVLLQAPDDQAPDGFVLAPGANVYFVDRMEPGTSGGGGGGTRTISAGPSARASLGDPSAFYEGQQAVLVDGYLNPLGGWQIIGGAWRQVSVSPSDARLNAGPAVTPDAIGVAGPVFSGTSASYLFTAGWLASTEANPRAGALFEWQFSTDGGATWGGIPSVRGACATVSVSSGTLSARVRHAATDGSLSEWAEYPALTYTPPVRYATRETPSGAVDGVNAAFSLANSPVPGSEEAYLDGTLQDEGGDYAISGPTVTFASAPPPGSKIRISYRY